MRRLLPAAALVLSAPLAAYAQDRGEWKSHVPAAEKVRESPLAHEETSVLAGGRLYDNHCAGCHGARGQGHRNKPAVTGGDTAQATDGELFWLLRNGVISKGMPSWVTLPEAQRWQLIAFVRSLALPATQTSAPEGPSK